MGILPTDRFRAQHEVIETIVGQIEAVLAQSTWPERALEVRLGFGELSEKLRLHLALEDEVFYPRLARHPDPTVRDLARTYQAEMGGIRQDYEDFLVEWLHSSKLTADPPGFETAVKTLFAALKDRIERENTYAYPLVETLEVSR